MGYLDGSTITVDAILTGEGRKKLANGGGLGITIHEPLEKTKKNTIFVGFSPYEYRHCLS